jgi:alkanesulfonate monooxygenase SsuD/methylene tetrahydromethanopterin reductase-like flavin-dependent oxidoreductase (luciferase family)
MSQQKALFGVALGAWNGAGEVPEVLRVATQADRGGLDFFAVADHPYFGDRLDAYATAGFVLGRTSGITGVVTVTNPARPAPLLARTITALSALSGGRVVLGIGAGFLWDEIVKMGVPRRSPGDAVRQMEETILLVRALSGGGDPVTFDGEFYQVSDLAPAPVAPPPVWTGSVGPKSLAVTGRLADGWVIPGGADWLNPRYRQTRAVLDEAAAAAGRDPAEIISIFNFGGEITAEPAGATRDDDGRWTTGSVQQWIDELTAAVLDRRASGFIYREPGGPASQTALARWAGEIVPAVREAVAKG